ncbi:hypothetical protein VIGAN_10000600, partial [Vigna angularis var. angularis]
TTMILLHVCKFELKISIRLFGAHYGTLVNVSLDSPPYSHHSKFRTNLPQDGSQLGGNPPLVNANTHTITQRTTQAIRY